MDHKKEVIQRITEEYLACFENEYEIDESPMAYKGMDEIIAQIGPTAEIVDIIKPVYNFKAAE